MNRLIKLTAISCAISIASCSAVNESDIVSVKPADASKDETKTSIVRPNVEQRQLKEKVSPDRSVVSRDVEVREEEAAQASLLHPAPRKKELSQGALSALKMQAPMVSMIAPPVAPHTPLDRENYNHFEDNALKFVAESPVSTFSIDVDTGSYSNVRRFLNQGQLPRQDAVRTEELINYFSYGYQAPNSEETPFSVYTELAPSPWKQQSVLMHIGLKGYELDHDNLPPSNLVFLIDVSGSMNSANKIGLLKQGFKLLTKQLRAQDTISVAVYAGSSGVVLEPTSGAEKNKILSAIERLSAGGSTNGAAGIKLAYQLAQTNFKKAGVNRVILATDGDFNVGTVNFEALKELVQERRDAGIDLTTLGFGTGNYNDHLMEQLADVGNGNYAYIDNLQEARKVLVQELGSTLKTIAKDVKIQVEFNPQTVASYRLIGYENRALKREDFNNDKVDAGDIGAGHTVTAIYEIDLVGNGSNRVDPLRYAEIQEIKSNSRKATANYDELAYLKLRYKLPNESNSRLISKAINKDHVLAEFNLASDPFKFSAAVAAFGQILRGGQYTGNYGYSEIVQLGLTAKGDDPWGYRSEFINLVRLAEQISK
ncbi:MAG: VWA domain-containing protein [Pseudomonadales bacterium]|nr:VWA domain-containing protein [Pseudomonadales bacterium]